MLSLAFASSSSPRQIFTALCVKTGQSMKIVWVFAVLAFPLSAFSSDADFLEQFVQGSYVVIGKNPESDETYHGHITIVLANQGLEASRSVAGQTRVAQARVESAIGGEAEVLRLRFEDEEEPVEQTCLVSSDLDNYARVTCHVYNPNVRTSRPGYEAWFSEHTAK